MFDLFDNEQWVAGPFATQEQADAWATRMLRGRPLVSIGRPEQEAKIPEGPEVEVFRRGLLPLVGQRVRKIELQPYRKARNPHDIRRLAGSQIQALWRKGKRMAIVTDRGLLVVGAGMSGYWRLSTTAQPEKHDHLVLHCERHVAAFNDARRFGSMEWLTPGDQSWYAGLGPDGLWPSFVSQQALVVAGLQRRARQPAKVALLDQGLIAGIGNIYASEILNCLRFDPRAPTEGLIPRVQELMAHTQRILQAAAEGMGTTIAGANPHRTPDGSATSLYPLVAYARETQPCLQPACDGTIVKFEQAGRSTYACSHCQLGGQ